MNFNGTRVVVPCKGCTAETGRHIGCHSDCCKYIEYTKVLEHEKAIIHKEKHKYDDFEAFKRKGIQQAYARRRSVGATG